MWMENNLIMNWNDFAALLRGQTNENLTKRRKLSVFQCITILFWTAAIMEMCKDCFTDDKSAICQAIFEDSYLITVTAQIK